MTDKVSTFSKSLEYDESPAEDYLKNLYLAITNVLTCRNKIEISVRIDTSRFCSNEGNIDIVPVPQNGWREVLKAQRETKKNKGIL